MWKIQLNHSAAVGWKIIYKKQESYRFSFTFLLLKIYNGILYDSTKTWESAIMEQTQENVHQTCNYIVLVIYSDFDCTYHCVQNGV